MPSIFVCPSYCVCSNRSRLEAERLRERQEMMEKLEAVKEAADQELSIQKQSYEEKLRSLEGTLVGVAFVIAGVYCNIIVVGCVLWYTGREEP